MKTLSCTWKSHQCEHQWDKVRRCSAGLGVPQIPRVGRASWLGEVNGCACVPRLGRGLGLCGLKSVMPTEGLPLTHTQVSLQLASGAFLLNQAFCEAIHVPMEKLKWTSPFTCHRVSLTTRQPPSPQPCTSPAPLHPSRDGLSQEPLAEGRPGQEPRAVVEHMGKMWATVVALAWLEHSSASYFVEWELVAAKASSWLEQQEVPEGRTQGTLKAAARQLFVLLRHWDENLEFNMLCYNPNYV